MLHHFTAPFFALVLLAPHAEAQISGPGLQWSGSSNNYAGSFVPSCQSLPVAMVAGETVTLTVWGDMSSPFGLFAATSASQCLPFPGIGNGLVLDLPVFTVTFGVLTLVTPCLSCPPGFQTLQFTVPAGLPAGTSISLQAAALGYGNPAFTVAITATV